MNAKLVLRRAVISNCEIVIQMQNTAVPKLGVRLRRLQRLRASDPDGSAREVRKWSKGRSTTDGAIAKVTAKDEPEDSNAEQFYKGKKALIVGAGPAGSVTASYLAKHGFLVDVFEKRDDPAHVAVKGKRTVLITLQRASVDVLRDTGISLPQSEHDLLDGIHRYSGLAYLKTDGQMLCLNAEKDRFLVERQALAKHVMRAARDRNPERVRFHFSRTCIDVDLVNQIVKFQRPDKEIIQQDYDLLIGADGADSEVRKAMERGIKTFSVYNTPNTLFYKSYRDVIVNEDKVYGNYRNILQHGLSTIYQNPKLIGEKEGIQAISLTRLTSGALNGNFYGTKSGFENVKGKEEEYLHEVMPEGFPQDWIDQMVPQLRGNSLYRLPSITEVSTMIGPHVVLVGDAAHTVGPKLGQGCNMAIQDGKALHDVLKVEEGDLDGALKKFNEVRLKEVSQVQLLAKVASVDTSEYKGIFKLLSILIQLHDAFHKYGHTHMSWVIPRAPVDRFRSGEIPTEKAAELLRKEFFALAVVISSVIILLLKALLSARW